jgi:hypothetical protein
VVGRFLSADSVQPNAPGTQGYNLYACVQNNPTTWVDPHGRSAVGDAFFSGISIVAACLLTEWRHDNLADLYVMINDGVELVVTGAPIAAEVGAWMAYAGALGMLVTLIDCALGIEIAWIDGAEIFSGCGGLAHTIYTDIKGLGSPNPFDQGHRTRPRLHIIPASSPAGG